MSHKYEASGLVHGEIRGVRRVQDHGRVQIPRMVRDKLGIKDGDQIYWMEESDGKIYVCKATRI